MNSLSLIYQTKFKSIKRLRSKRSLFLSNAFLIGCCLIGTASTAQQNAQLEVDKIMQDSRWIGISPSQVQWSLNSDRILFNWDKEQQGTSSFYQITPTDLEPRKLSEAALEELPMRGLCFTGDQLSALFERNGDIFIVDIANGQQRQITNTVEQESEPLFSGDETRIVFRRAENLYSVERSTGMLTQLTNFTRIPFLNNILGEKDQWLREDQLVNFQVLQQSFEDRDPVKKKTDQAFPRPIYLDEQSSLDQISISPDSRFVVYRIRKQGKGKATIVPNYVTASGYTETIAARSKVGETSVVYQTRIYDRERDSVYNLSTHSIAGIKDIPDFVKEYPKQLRLLRQENKDREVFIGAPLWNQEGSVCVVDIRAQNNKDRWIMRLDLETGELNPLERQHDPAWIGGPGIGRGFSGSQLGWIDNNWIYFQSEETGYSHVYKLEVHDGFKEQLTFGNYEVQTLQLSKYKDKFYFTGNMQHPGITHFYQIGVGGGTPVQLTSLKGGNEVLLSPDEKWLAIRHSYTTKPWELYLQENIQGAQLTRITTSTTPEFESYPWRDPEMVTFKNRYGTEIHAQVFTPESADPAKPAVVFIHSNGYLQNVHYRWSYHFREYMFHNLLVDRGYTVINIDYTASSGYGREMRTGIYRHMGGKDLSDLTDGTKWLIENYDVNPENIGLYGGSYGGFLTLMGLFTEPQVFKSGAALRSVTDWAHYNHGYTSNILNEPTSDERAYKRSSPIYFAEGLQGNLLMTHGVIDVNVQFQDVVRLTQRLIELGKRNWDLAVYPLEDHDFIEPSSWIDQYHRILKLFEETLKPNISP